MFIAERDFDAALEAIAPLLEGSGVSPRLVLERAMASAGIETCGDFPGDADCRKGAFGLGDYVEIARPRKGREDYKGRVAVVIQPSFEQLGKFGCEVCLIGASIGSPVKSLYDTELRLVARANYPKYFNKPRKGK